MYMIGAQIGFFQGDVKKLMDDIKELQPTLFPCVPRLLNRFYDKVSSMLTLVASVLFVYWYKFADLDDRDYVMGSMSPS
jgi:long-chain acyl-CoA synthetase